MENEVQIFQNEEFGEVRTVMINNEPWFVAADVCRALALSNPTVTVARLDEDERAKFNLGRQGEATVVSECGLYTLILSSRKSEARQFKRWITHEVIPSIRRHGVYMTEDRLEQVIYNPEFVLQMAQEFVKAHERNETLTQQLQIAQPKADYFDQFVKADDCTNIRNTAKELEIPEKQFVHFLLEHHYLYRDRQDRLMPCGQYLQKGWFSLRDVYQTDGKMLQQTLLTCKGKNHFRKLLKRGEPA